MRKQRDVRITQVLWKLKHLVVCFQGGWTVRTLPFDSFQRASPISLAIISELCGSLFLFFLSFTIKISNQCNDDEKFIYNSLNKYSRDKILAAVPPYCLILVRRLKRSKHVHSGLKAVFTLLVIYDSKNQNHPSWFLSYPIHLFWLICYLPHVVRTRIGYIPKPCFRLSSSISRCSSKHLSDCFVSQQGDDPHQWFIFYRLAVLFISSNGNSKTDDSTFRSHNCCSGSIQQFGISSCQSMPYHGGPWSYTAITFLN